MNTLGLKLLDLRQKHNLTQKQLCRELNIGRSTYSYFETGTRTPDIETLILIAEYYHVSLDELVSRHPKKEENEERQLSKVEEVDIVRHLKAKRIPVHSVMELSKREFDFLEKFRELSREHQDELIYLTNYKLRHTKK